MSKRCEICLAVVFLFGWSFSSVTGVSANAGTLSNGSYIDIADHSKKTNFFAYPFHSKNPASLFYKSGQEDETLRHIFLSHGDSYQKNQNENQSASLSSQTNRFSHSQNLPKKYANGSRDPLQLIKNHHRLSQRERREARTDHAQPKLEARIIVRVRRRRSRTPDFTQVNKDVCPPSLCRAMDERSRGGGGRPKGTGGTVFYQGDIVLDRDLDRMIYPSTAKPNAQRQRSNQGRSRSANNSNSSGSSGTRQRQNSEPRKLWSQRRRCRGKRRSLCHRSRRKDHPSSKGNRKRLRKTRSITRNGQIQNTIVNEENRRIQKYTEVKDGLQYGHEDKDIGMERRLKEGVAVSGEWRMQERSDRKRRATMKLRSRLWKNGVVVYRMEREIRPAAKRVIQRAIAHIQEKTCIRFREKKDSDTDYIRFISEPGCWSQIGRVGGSQMVSLGRGCESLGTAVHEIVHSLGVWHEQARPDRNRFVRILEDNISERFRPDFEAVRRRLATDRGYPYDYQSLMHYSQYAFTRNGKPTIQVIGTGRTLNLRIGQRRGLSTIDISQLRDMYKCNQKQDIKETVCHKTWRKHTTSCYKFVTSSPAQFEAAHRACVREKANLVAIENSREQRFIDKVLGETFPRVTRWRTAGRLVNKTMVWYLGSRKLKNISSYENWARGHPGSRTSIVLYRDPRSGSVKWLGESTGDRTAPNHHRLPFICEKPARRKCVDLRYRDGRDYRGHLDHTRDGYTCQRWTENYPHNHPLVNESQAAAAWMRSSARRNNSNTQSQRFKDGLGSHNKCRNPSGLRRNRPWCYTTKRRHEWGYCDVSPCTSSLRQTGRGNSSLSRSGNTSSTRRTTRDMNPNRRTAKPTVSRGLKRPTVSRRSSVRRTSNRRVIRRRPSKQVSMKNRSQKEKTANRNSKTRTTAKESSSNRQKHPKLVGEWQGTAQGRSKVNTTLKRISGVRKTLMQSIDHLKISKKDTNLRATAHIKVETATEKVRRRKIVNRNTSGQDILRAKTPTRRVMRHRSRRSTLMRTVHCSKDLKKIAPCNI